MRNVTKYFELLHRKQPTATVRAPRSPPPHFSRAHLLPQMTWERPVLPWSRTRPQFLSALPLSKRNPLSPRPQGASTDPAAPTGTNTLSFPLSLSLTFFDGALNGAERGSGEPLSLEQLSTAPPPDAPITSYPGHLHLHPGHLSSRSSCQQLWRAQGLA